MWIRSNNEAQKSKLFYDPTIHVDTNFGFSCFSKWIVEGLFWKDYSSPNFTQSFAPVLVCLLLLLREHDSYKGNMELG